MNGEKKTVLKTKGKSMKKHLCLLFVCLSACPLGVPLTFADTLVLSNNRTVSGTVIQTNGDDVLLLTAYATYNFSRANIKEIKAGPVEAEEFSSTNRLPDFQRTILFLSRRPWATNLSPIAATVIDDGILRNVPYTSFRCGQDYEVNVYGDLDHPAGIEIGVYRKLIEDGSAKNNCVKFISDLLGQSADKEIVKELDLKKDLKTSDGLTFEITPPTAEDAYNGWWISVYSEQKLSLARASDKELDQISIAKADAAKEASQSDNPSAWSADELKLARPSPRTTITFTNTSGVVIWNAQVVRVIDGVSLIWEKNNGASGGMVRLADLPEELRNQFGYDPVKTAAADALQEKRRANEQQQALAAQAAQAAQESQITPAQDYSYSDYASGGGRVYVHGYYRANGTYVHAYTRSYPHGR